MDDNTQQPADNTPATPDPLQQPQSFKPLVLPKNKLEELPPEIRIELDAFLKRDANINKTKTLLENKWLGKSDALPASYSTYKAYFDLHRLRLHKEREEEMNQLRKTQQDLLGFQDMVGDIADGKGVEFRKKYQDILDFIEDRLAFVIEHQSHGFSSPQYEAVMVQLVKAKKEILEKMEDYKDEVDEQRHAKNLAFFDNFAYELVLAVINLYKKVNGDIHLSEFKSELKTEIGKIAERTKTNYSRDLNDL